ncbi:unnamed protein product [Darwinula stevensoni]|uniref:Dystrophin n=1 Tax=Darwinula stevensoni TaxID=69355 RepID=A0A7R8X3Q7_9CRUS|nr:unnamed protein product [Darwinula stevensoni]CAG0878917.1 unnamed protein product [Darwinula stevensoni]
MFNVNTPVPDKKSIMMYVMCLFQVLPHSMVDVAAFEADHSTSDSQASRPSSRPLSLTSVDMTSYQGVLEEVLAWLLEAEDRLQQEGDIGTSLDTVRKQFQHHEEFMLELRQEQDSVGVVLQEGNRLISEGRMSDEEESEVRVQMKLLSTRWEELRLQAMDRQDKLQENLMSLQQLELSRLRAWLTELEDAISKQENPGPSFEDFQHQVQKHGSLANKLREMQGIVTLLSDMVVVVDESDTDNEYSGLEDELAAVGERWSHVCGWVESRGKLLRELSSHWDPLEEKRKTLLTWLEAKESLLEKSPLTLTELQAVRSEAEVEHARLQNINEGTEKVGHLLGKESQGEKLLRDQLTSLHAKWDSLLLQLDSCRETVTANGKPGAKHEQTDVDGGSLAKRTRIELEEVKEEEEEEMEEGEDEEETEEEEEGEEEGKMEGPKEQWTCLTSKFSKVLDHLEAILGITEISDESFDRLSVERQLTVYDVSDVEVRRTLMPLDSRWQIVEENLYHRGQALERTRERLRISKEQMLLDTPLQELMSWQDEHNTIPDDPEQLHSGIQECLKQEEEMKKYQDQLERFLDEVEQLGDHAVFKDVKRFENEWRTALKKLTEHHRSLVEKVRSTGALPPKYKAALEGFQTWLGEVEDTIGSKSPSIIGLDSIKELLRKFKAVEEELTSQEDSFKFIKDTGDKILEEMTGEHQDKLKQAVSLVERLERDLQQLMDEIEGLNSWMGEVDVFLHAEPPAVGDPETLEAQLEQSNALQDDIKTLQESLKGINVNGEQILASAASSFGSSLREKLMHLNKRWETVVSEARKQNAILHNALRDTQEVLNGVDVTCSWLDDLEARIPTPDPIRTPQDLSSLLSCLRELKDEITTKQQAFQDLNEKANELLLQVEAGNKEVLARQATHMNSRWTEVVTSIDRKHASVRQLSQLYAKVKGLIQKENDWLKQLACKVERSSRAAADAEEISAALDELENFVSSRDLDKLEDTEQMVRELSENNIMADSLQAEIDRINVTWHTLRKQASDRQKLMEGNIEEAQEWERSILSCQEWISCTDTALSRNLHSDIFPGDTTEEHQRMMDEFDKFSQQMGACQAQVDKYRMEGNVEAASRLGEQLALLQGKFKDLEGKILLFRGVTQIQPRLTRLLRLMNELEQNLCLTDLSSDDPDSIQGHLNHCNRFGKEHTDLKEEVEEVIRKGQEAVQQQQVPDPHSLKIKLEKLQESYHQVGQKIGESRRNLEQALRVSRTLSQQRQALEVFLLALQTDLQKHQENDPVKDVPAEVEFIQKCIGELEGNRNILSSLRKGYSTLLALSEGAGNEAIQAHLLDINQLWDSVQERLHKRQKDLQMMQENRDVLLQEFLSQSEVIGQYLDKVKECLPSAIAKLSELQREMGIMRAKMESMRDTAVIVMAHGDAFQSQVQPRLSAINQQWDQLVPQLEAIETPAPSCRTSHSYAMSPNNDEILSIDIRVEDVDDPHGQVYHSDRIPLRKFHTPIVSALPRFCQGIIPQEAVEESKKMEHEKAEIKEEKLAIGLAEKNVTAGSQGLWDSDKVELLGELREVSINMDQLEKFLENSDSDSQDFILTMEGHLGDLESQVALILSRGDTLMLMVHQTEPNEAVRLQEILDSTRKRWMALKHHALSVKRSVEIKELSWKDYRQRIEEMVKKLDATRNGFADANNDLVRLQTLQNEVCVQETEIQNLEKEGESYPSHREQIVKLLRDLNLRWEELQTLCRLYIKPDVEKLATPEKAESVNSVVVEYLLFLKGLHEGIGRAWRILRDPPLGEKLYDSFPLQEEALKVLLIPWEELSSLFIPFTEAKKIMDSLKPGMASAELRRIGLASELAAKHPTSTSTQANMQRALDSLKDEWSKVNRAYNDRHSRWLEAREVWLGFQGHAAEMEGWLLGVPSALLKAKSDDLPIAQAAQRELERHVTSKHRTVTLLSQSGQTILRQTSRQENADLRSRLDDIMNRWRSALADLAANRDRVTQLEDSLMHEKESTRKTVAAIGAWLAHTNALLASSKDVADHRNGQETLRKLQMREKELPEMRAKLSLIKKTVDPKEFVEFELRLEKVKDSLKMEVERLKVCVVRLEKLATLMVRLRQWLDWVTQRLPRASHDIVKDDIAPTSPVLIGPPAL